MISLLDILSESKALEIPEWETKVAPQLKNIYQIVKKTYDKIIEKASKTDGKSYTATFNFIPKIKLKDIKGKNIEVQMGFFYDPNTNTGAFMSNDSTTFGVNLAHNWNKESFMSIASHELVHAVDPKLKGVFTREMLKSKKKEIINFLLKLGISKNEILQAYKSNDIYAKVWELLNKYNHADKIKDFDEFLKQAYSLQADPDKNQDEYYKYFWEFDAYSRNIIDILTKAKNTKDKNQNLIDPVFFKESLKKLMVKIPKTENADEIVNDSTFNQSMWLFLDPRQWEKPRAYEQAISRFKWCFSILKAWSTDPKIWKKFNQRLAQIL